MEHPLAEVPGTALDGTQLGPDSSPSQPASCVRKDPPSSCRGGGWGDIPQMRAAPFSPSARRGGGRKEAPCAPLCVCRPLRTFLKETSGRSQSSSTLAGGVSPHRHRHPAFVPFKPAPAGLAPRQSVAVALNGPGVAANGAGSRDRTFPLELHAGMPKVSHDWPGNPYIPG